MADQRLRVRVVRLVLVGVLAAAGLRLVHVQMFEAAALSEKATRQRTVQVSVPAARGEIRDRTGGKLAFSVTTKALSWSPKAMRAQYGGRFEARTAEIAARIKSVLGDRVDERELLAKLRGSVFTYLATDVDSSQEKEITRDFEGEIGVEARTRREYPGGGLASNVVGHASWRTNREGGQLNGWYGLEASMDTVLAGEPGRVTVDTEEGTGGVVIPGTERDPYPARNGADIELTLDPDIQYQAERLLAGTGATSGSVVVLDARTAEIQAIADTGNAPDNRSVMADLRTTAVSAVSTAYNPGPVQKIVTAAATIEHGLTGPADLIRVPAADGIARDEGRSGDVTMSVTGVFAKSSDVGTLLLARQIGPDRYAATLEAFGLGTRTGAGLPGESAGSIPARSKWSASTLDELAIGRGMSATVLQMTGTFQAIANDGLRVAPRIVKAIVDDDGTRHPEPAPQAVRVVGDRTAITVREMLRASVQDLPDQQRGVAASAAVPGYQVAVMAGPGQGNVTTLAGILPVGRPRFVIGIALETPGGQVDAGPLFRDIATYLTQRFSLPLAVDSPPPVTLVR
jgi:cell division protein FtsI (penicillin-binding protein 3)